ncbi:MAG: hypothetical protein JNK68_02520 [Betaproteobacteria bacterium]|nr:hypothetical protein [Betaproteobacteria bacterium]
MKRCTVGALTLGAVLAATTVSTQAQALFDRRPVLIADPVPGRFSVCHGHTCSVVVTVGLSAAEWQRVRSVFAPSPPDAAAERGRIAAAIALMEDMVGTYTGTWRDLGGDVRGFARPGQMDCVDEATNSTTYLQMLAADHLLEWHTVGPVLKRGHLLWGVPHATAVIVETASGGMWAVDSWFLDNGLPPYIVPYRVWRKNWYPESN